MKREEFAGLLLEGGTQLEECGVKVRPQALRLIVRSTTAPRAPMDDRLPKQMRSLAGK
jgi:hypothetical protein